MNLSASLSSFKIACVPIGFTVARVLRIPRIEPTIAYCLSVSRNEGDSGCWGTVAMTAPAFEPVGPRDECRFRHIVPSSIQSGPNRAAHVDPGRLSPMTVRSPGQKGAWVLRTESLQTGKRAGSSELTQLVTLL